MEVVGRRRDGVFLPPSAPMLALTAWNSRREKHLSGVFDGHAGAFFLFRARDACPRLEKGLHLIREQSRGHT